MNGLSVSAGEKLGHPEDWQGIKVGRKLAGSQEMGWTLITVHTKRLRRPEWSPEVDPHVMESSKTT